MNIRELLDELQEKKDLRDEALLALLRSKDPDLQEELHARARSVAREHFGKEIYLRGLVEWSNVCRNDCLLSPLRPAAKPMPCMTTRHMRRWKPLSTSYPVRATALAPTGEIINTKHNHVQSCITPRRGVYR